MQDFSAFEVFIDKGKDKYIELLINKRDIENPLTGNPFDISHYGVTIVTNILNSYGNQTIGVLSINFKIFNLSIDLHIAQLTIISLNCS